MKNKTQGLGCSHVSARGVVAKRARLCFDTRGSQGLAYSSGEADVSLCQGSVCWDEHNSISVPGQLWELVDSQEVQSCLGARGSQGWDTGEELTWAAKPNEAIKAFERFRPRSSPLPAAREMLYKHSPAAALPS